MSRFRKRHTGTVLNTGALAGFVLCGIGSQNLGLRVKVFEDQPKGRDGPISGNFSVLDSGDNVNSGVLHSFTGLVTNAQELLALLRAERPGCINVVNTNILATET